MKTRVLILLAILLFGACTFEMEDDPTPVGPGEVSLGLYTEGGNFRVPTTRGAIDESEELGTMPWVLVFRGTTDAAVFYEAKQAVADGSGGAKVTLRTTIDPSRILILANIPTGASFFDGTTQTVFSETALNTACATKTFAQVVDNLLYTAPLATTSGGTTTSIPYDGGYLPMSAVTDLNTIDETSTIGTNSSKILLKRAVAKVTVDATVANTADGFVLSGVSVVGSRRYGRFHQLASGTVPTLATTGWVNYLTSTPDVIVSASGNTTTNSPIYVYEGASTDGTVVIVKGTLPGLGSANPQYYRLSLTNTAGTALAIERNKHYKFEIKSVSGGGYTSMTDALAATGTSNNLTATVEVTDLSSHDIIDNGQYYLGVTNSEFMLYSNDAVTTADNMVLTSVASDAPSSQTVTVIPSVTGGSGTFTVSVASSIPNTTAQDVVIAQMDASVTAGQVIVRVGNLTKIIQVSRKSTLIFAANTVEFANEYVSAEVASQGTGGSDWLSLSLDGTTSQGGSVTQPSTAGSIYLKTTVNVAWTGGTTRTGGEVYLARHDKQGRVKVNIHQAVVNAESVPVTPMSVNAYVGAFWRASEIGERIIRVKVGSTATDLGDWTAAVVWTDDRWNDGDIVMSTAPTRDPGVTWNAATEMHTNPDAGGYYVPGNATDVAGTVAANGEVYYRVGLKTKYTPTTNNPARYAVVLFAYNNNTQFTKLYLRQGEQADYVMRQGDPSTGEATDRSKAKKWLPYNITAPLFKVGVSANPNNNTNAWVNVRPTWAKAASLAVPVDYPTQAGGYFKWAHTEGVRAYNPSGNPTVPANWDWGLSNAVVRAVAWSDPDPLAASHGGAGTTIAQNYESCPTGYRRPTDGNTTVINQDPVNVANSEVMQSLVLAPASGTNSSSNDISNSLYGFYADGFFDRRTLEPNAGDGKRTAVSVNNSLVAYVGRLYYNPMTNAHLFLPASGRRESEDGRHNNEVGLSGLYWTASSAHPDGAWVLIFQSGAVIRHFGVRYHGFPIRCVAE